MTHFTKLNNLSMDELKKMAKKYNPINSDLINKGCFDNDRTMLVKIISTSPAYMKNFKGVDFMALMKFNANLK